MATHTTIKIPNTNASETASLATALLSAADAEVANIKKGVLPQSIELPRQRLAKACAALVDVITPVESDADPNAGRNAHIALDAAWAAFDSWLTAWTLVPLENQDAATALHSLLLPDGRPFTQLAYLIEYQESDRRLRAITADAESLVDSLGGTLLLQHLRECNDAYGVALGVTQPAAVAATPKIKVVLDACLAAIRVYANKVVAYEDPDIAGSADLVARLLAPLVNLKPRRAHKKAVDPAPAPPTPAPLPAKT